MDEINYQAIGEQLVESLKGKPYGSIPKKELDLLLFSILHRNHYYGEKKNYEISLELMISEARLDNILYDMKLRKLENKIISPEEMANVISTFSFNKEKGTFIINIPDIFTKNAILNELEKRKIIYDFTLNKRLIALDANQYSKILDDFLTNEQKNEIMKLAKTYGLANDSFKEISFKILGVIAKNASDGAVSALLGPVSVGNSLIGIFKDTTGIVHKLVTKEKKPWKRIYY